MQDNFFGLHWSTISFHKFAGILQRKIAFVVQPSSGLKLYLNFILIFDTCEKNEWLYRYLVFENDFDLLPKWKFSDLKVGLKSGGNANVHRLLIENLGRDSFIFKDSYNLRL